MEIINKILLEQHARDLWLPVIDRLFQGTQRYMSITDALERAFADIDRFMTENAEILQADPDRMRRRMADLHVYKTNITENFIQLANGAKEYLAAQQASVTPKPK